MTWRRAGDRLLVPFSWPTVCMNWTELLNEGGGICAKFNHDVIASYLLGLNIATAHIWPGTPSMVFLACSHVTVSRLLVHFHMNGHTDTDTRLTALFPGLPRWAATRKVKPNWFYWSKRQWVAVAPAGPYGSLHVAPDRKPCQHPTTLFFTGRMPFLPPNQQCQSTKTLVNAVKTVSKCYINLFSTTDTKKI